MNSHSIGLTAAERAKLIADGIITLPPPIPMPIIKPPRPPQRCSHCSGLSPYGPVCDQCIKDGVKEQG